MFSHIEFYVWVLEEHTELLIGIPTLRHFVISASEKRTNRHNPFKFTQASY